MLIFRLVLPSSLMAVLFVLGLTGCSSSKTPIEYPEVDVQSIALELTINDPRRQFRDRVTEPTDPSEMGSETFEQRLPDSFEQKAIERLERITAKSGPTLRVQTTVERADVTFIHEPRGKFVRYDVELSFKVTTESGALLERGLGAAWNELPEREATEQTLKQTYEATALEAFDRYFADEDTLNTINAQLDRFLQSPAARQP